MKILDKDSRRLAGAANAGRHARPVAGVHASQEEVAAVGVVALVMLTSFVIGTQHPRLLTCEDFSISGNFAPVDCSPGTASTQR